MCPLCDLRVDAGTLELLCQTAFRVREPVGAFRSQDAGAARSAKERFLHNLPMGKQTNSWILAPLRL